ncbi:SDR family NAD(P)-dependent oxidoreductase [Candidatus Bipolaricaulota bacterium]
MPYALITGSTKGIGLSIATELAARGLIPILNYHTDDEAADRALSTITDICSKARVIQADVTTEAGVQFLFETVLRCGDVEVLVNNVGRFLYKPFLDTSLSDWNGILSSNLFSAVLCCQQVLPSMRKRRRGHIINIAAMHADRIRARPNTLPYAIAKSGIVQLTQTLAKTEGPYGIRVNAVCPGFIAGGEHTTTKHSSKVPLGRLGQSEEIAGVVGFLVSKDAGYVTGAVLNVHGGALL